MNLKYLTDNQLLADLKLFVKSERELLTKILHHLKEIESRKLFSSCGYKSLYDYTIKELNYTESQAYRRIQAMRVLKELPQLESKIESGALSLSNLTQAQSFFKESNINNKEEKLLVIKKLENKSFRESKKELLSLQPEKPLPQEVQKIVSPTHTELNFTATEGLQSKLEQVRTLLGPKGLDMKLSELVETMANLAIQKLEEQRFGKKRVTEVNSTLELNHNNVPKSGHDVVINSAGNESESNHPVSCCQNNIIKSCHQIVVQQTAMKSVTKSAANEISLEKTSAQSVNNTNTNITNSNRSKNPRYISNQLKHHIWLRDQAKCTKCGSQRNIQYDHIQPLSLGGKSVTSNLRLLCFHCNQRQRITAGLGSVQLNFL